MTAKSSEPAPSEAPKASAKNPSGASEEQLKKGEMTGVARGPDVDSSFHVYEFTDPLTGEPVETKQSEGANQGESGETGEKKK